ncbi:MAG: hypothetical protein HC881_06950 [Leptolyngbyaceae cyanobacterium SL_7_1]|nr:hypothetical protein [Leptolyngbyaceae cyanobacterium SL_7_1]
MDANRRNAYGLIALGLVAIGGLGGYGVSWLPDPPPLPPPTVSVLSGDCNQPLNMAIDRNFNAYYVQLSQQGMRADQPQLDQLRNTIKAKVEAYCNSRSDLPRPVPEAVSPWFFIDPDECNGLLNEITDRMFYRLYPQWRDRPIPQNELPLIRAWKQIRVEVNRQCPSIQPSGE